MIQKSNLTMLKISFLFSVFRELFNLFVYVFFNHVNDAEVLFKLKIILEKIKIPSYRRDISMYNFALKNKSQIIFHRNF
jgi:hypothetical protein